jgi:CRISPR/Cas system CSM-associated protein Csm2 small subunit
MLLLLGQSSSAQGPPEPKQITVAEARSALTGLIGAMQRPASEKQIQIALQQLAMHLNQQPADPKKVAEGRYKALMPVLDRITQDVATKHGFDGFTQMVMSIQKAAADSKDADMMQKLLPIRELVTGNNDARTKGRIFELDALVSGFALLGPENQKLTLKKVQEVVAMLKNKPMAKFYLKTMKKIMKEGKSFPEVEGKRLIGLIKAEGTPEKKRMKYTKHVNILSAFFSPEEINALMSKKKYNPKHDEM